MNTNLSPTPANGIGVGFSWSGFFIVRPIATALLTFGIALSGLVAFFQLPIAPLPQVDFPVIMVSANLPGANPEVMASTVAMPLERALGTIAGVNEITSNSSQGSTNITLQFDLERNINSAAREVQAAIQAARPLLPTGMSNAPSYRKINPADAPIMLISMSSPTLTRAQIYDAASSIVAQRLSQIPGIGQVNIGGGALPGVRVEVDPQRLYAMNISMDEVRLAINNANANRPKGVVEDQNRQWQINTNDQAKTARDYEKLIIRYVEGKAVYISDVAKISDSVSNIRNFGASNGKPAIMLLLYKQANANIIDTVAQVRAVLPRLQNSISQAIDLEIRMDRTTSIKASIREVERTMLLSIVIVMGVVWLFLRNRFSAMIPSVVIPVSLGGTFALMYLMGLSINNLSMMALTIAVGFVVDDAIVVLENITRHIESGKSSEASAMIGTREIGFTVVAMSLSLIAVFIPILLMDGIVGRFFREFAIVLSGAVLISMVISLTTTPMMCRFFLRHFPKQTRQAPKPKVGAGIAHCLATMRNRWQQRLYRFYRRTLAKALRHQALTLMVFIAVIGINGWLFVVIPKGLFPQQDLGLVMAGVQADQSSSFQIMRTRLLKLMKVIQADPAVESVNGFTGGARVNSAQMFLTLKPLAERGVATEVVIARLRSQLAQEPGARVFMQAAQDFRVGGRGADAQYQYTLMSDDLDLLRTWEPKVRQTLAQLPQITDVNTDSQDKGLQVSLALDREQLAALGIGFNNVDTTLNAGFGQMQVATIYHPLNQYRVILSFLPEYLESPQALSWVHLFNSQHQRIPLSQFAQTRLTNAPLQINHQSGMSASTISFNLPVGTSLSQAETAINQALGRIQMPINLQGSLQGVAQVFQKTLANPMLLIVIALVTVYIVLGILYENLIHPLTILSTLPPAGVGALIALQISHTEFSVIAMIGIFLLIGIVKKNAILMIDFAIARQRQGMNAVPAIFRACRIRVRPIMMTTLAAIGGAIPLALATGDGTEIRQPLGIAVVGGLILSQLLTLYTTPVIFVLMDRLSFRTRQFFRA